MSNYRIIVCGVMPGRTVDEVVEGLSRVSTKPPATLRALLDGRRVVVKRTMEVAKAAQYKRTLTKIGCICTIEADGATPIDPSAAITVNITKMLDQGHQQLASVREFIYPSRARMGLMGLLAGSRVCRWLAVVGTISIFYFSFRFLVEHGWAASVSLLFRP